MKSFKLYQHRIILLPDNSIANGKYTIEEWWLNGKLVRGTTPKTRTETEEIVIRFCLEDDNSSTSYNV